MNNILKMLGGDTIWAPIQIHTPLSKARNSRRVWEILVAPTMPKKIPSVPVYHELWDGVSTDSIPEKSPSPYPNNALVEPGKLLNLCDMGGFVA